MFSFLAVLILIMELVKFSLLNFINFSFSLILDQCRLQTIEQLVVSFALELLKFIDFGLLDFVRIGQGLFLKI